MSTRPTTMAGAVLTRHGGLDAVEYRRDLPVPSPGAGEVLIRVAASSVNNTDINTRIGWYSKTVAGATNAGGAAGFDTDVAEDGSWSGVPLRFPRIQGADCYGEIVGLGAGVPDRRLGEKVLVRSLLRAPVAFRPHECWTFGSETDGGFADYAVAPADDTFAVDSALSAVELGVIPCAYSTAEGMLVRADVSGDDRVLITGASGGVGLAAVQLARLRGAEVVAVAAPSKAAPILAQGAEQVLARDANLLDALGRKSLTVVVDLVGGAAFAQLPELLRRGGRYVTAGAIAGPIVDLDLRTLYLNDLTMLGCTAQDDAVFPNLIRYLSEGRLKPVVAATFPLREIRAAQEKFLSKDFVGKIALAP